MYLISRALQGTRNSCHHPAMRKKDDKGKVSLDFGLITKFQILRSLTKAFVSL